MLYIEIEFGSKLITGAGGMNIRTFQCQNGESSGCSILVRSCRVNDIP